MNVFANIAGQDRVCAYLQAALDTGRTTHAYLLVGADADLSFDIALRFGAALIAGDDAEAFAEAIRGAHPDMHPMKPAGASAYLVEQVRDMVRDAELAPVRAPHKVYILQHAEHLSGAPANALLKTLEEPPSDVVCLLLANKEHAVLETVRSRCEVLRLSAAQAEQPQNEEVFQLLYSVLSGADNRQVLAAAKRMVELSSAQTEHMEEEHAERLAENEEFLTQGARKALETQHKREVTSHVRKELLDELAAVRSWLRDCLLVAEGVVDLRAHEGWAYQTMQVGTDVGVEPLLAALSAVKSCEERISYNVTPQLAIEALLFEIREAVCQ